MFKLDCQYGAGDFKNDYSEKEKKLNTVDFYKRRLYENKLQKKALEDIVNNLITEKNYLTVYFEIDVI